MKTLTSFVSLFLVVVSLNAQGLLNKIKTKATQEVKKIENTASGNTTAPASNNKLSANVVRTVITTLNANETFDYQESCINLSLSLNQVAFVIRAGGKCFEYKNGTRTAIPCPTGYCGGRSNCSYKTLRKISTEEESKYFVKEKGTTQQAMPGLSPEQVKMMESMMTKEQIAEMKKSMVEANKAIEDGNVVLYINFKGKKYGPYTYADFYLTGSGSNFYAMVQDNEYKTKIISSTSAKSIELSTNSPVSEPIVSPDETDFGILVVNQTQKYVMLTASGKTYPVAGGVGTMKAWLTNGNHVASLSETQLLLDGKAVKTIENAMNLEPCDVFVSADGKNVTTIVENRVLFADGDIYEYPMAFDLFKEGTANFYKWIALENNELVLYKKPHQ